MLFISFYISDLDINTKRGVAPLFVLNEQFNQGLK
jgi:hypothetical protein